MCSSRKKKDQQGITKYLDTSIKRTTPMMVKSNQRLATTARNRQSTPVYCR